MRDTNLVNALREHAEWAEGNQWETPITLGDDLAEAADRMENQNAHIAALQQEIEKLRGQNEQLREAAALVAKKSAELLERRWIPVTERLPEYDARVLAFDMRAKNKYIGIWTREKMMAMIAGLIRLAGGMRLTRLHTGCHCRNRRRRKGKNEKTDN